MRSGSSFNVHLEQLEKNFAELQKITTKPVIFMIKANAYGHGLIPIYEFCQSQLGITHFGCASLGEALSIRKESSLKDSKLIVFSETDLSLENLKTHYIDGELIPVIESITDLQLFLETECYKALPLYLKFNTGMNRLGFIASELKDILKMLKSFGINKIDHLMTHFSSSYQVLKQGDRTHRQYEEFLKIKEVFKEENISVLDTSVSNSGAIEQQFGLEESMIRPGLMLYGPQSTMTRAKVWTGQDIGSLKTTVIKKTIYKKGTPVGYGAPVLGDHGFIALIPLGYGDGILTFYSGIKLSYGSLIRKIFGRINMDLTAIYCSDKDDLKEKDNLILFGKESSNSIVEIATQAKTSPYQILTAISSRVPRKYIYPE